MAKGTDKTAVGFQQAASNDHLGLGQQRNISVLTATIIIIIIIIITI